MDSKTPDAAGQPAFAMSRSEARAAEAAWAASEVVREYFEHNKTAFLNFRGGGALPPGIRRPSVLLAPRFQRTAAQTARVHVRIWQLIERALAAEQFSDDARAAVQRLDEQVQTFARGDIQGCLPAEVIEGCAEFMAAVGDIPVHVGNNEFIAIGAHRDAARPGVDTNDGGEGHGAVSEEGNSVAHQPSTTGSAA